MMMMTYREHVPPVGIEGQHLQFYDVPHICADVPGAVEVGLVGSQLEPVASIA